MMRDVVERYQVSNVVGLRWLRRAKPIGKRRGGC
jgi:hypothetical protein